jgi:hypothetical protein
VETVIGSILLMLCYLKGNRHNPIQHFFWHDVPPEAAVDSRPDRWTGSRLFEVNIWMWRYGRAFIPKKLKGECSGNVEEACSRVKAKNLNRRLLAVAARQAAG